MADNIQVNVTQPANQVALNISERGQKGDAGPTGSDGAAGEGVPTGGTTGQALIKSSGADYATEWGDAGQTFDQDLNTTDSPQFEGLTVSNGGVPSYSTSTFEAGLESAGNMTVTSGGVVQVYSSISNPGVDSESLKISVSDDGDATIATVDEGAGSAGDIILDAATVTLRKASAPTTEFTINASGAEWDFRSNSRLYFPFNHFIGTTSAVFQISTEPNADLELLAGGTGRAKINGPSETAADPTTIEYPNDGDWGIHRNTSSGDVFLAFNDSGTIKKVQLT